MTESFASPDDKQCIPQHVFDRKALAARCPLIAKLNLGATKVKDDSMKALAASCPLLAKLVV